MHIYDDIMNRWRQLSALLFYNPCRTTEDADISAVYLSELQVEVLPIILEIRINADSAMLSLSRNDILIRENQILLS